MYAICRKHAAPTEETPSRAYHRKLKLLAPGIEDGERGVGNITYFMFRGHTKLEMELTTENISDPQEGCTGLGQNWMDILNLLENINCISHVLQSQV